MPTISIYRSDLALFPRDPRWEGLPVANWQEYRFRPRPLAESEGAEFAKYRSASVEIRVRVPVGSKLIGEGKGQRLAVYWDPQGIDAGTVFYVAQRGEGGLSIDGTGLENRVDASHVQHVAGLHQD